MMSDKTPDLSAVNRVVLVDFTRHEGTFQTAVRGDIDVIIDMQDNGRTLKVFVKTRNSHNED
jgi:hypothetical protein